MPRRSISAAPTSRSPVAELKRRGVTFVDEPHRIAEMDDHDLWMAFFRDPDDHLMALMQEAPKGYVPSQEQNEAV